MENKISKLRNLISILSKNGHISTLPPVSEDKIRDVSEILSLCEDLIDFYLITNGCVSYEIEILPIYDPNNFQKTWDDIMRANDISTTKFSIPSKEFLDNNTIFASLGGGKMAFYSKNDGSIWYETDDSYYQTSLDLYAFIEGMAKIN